MTKNKRPSVLEVAEVLRKYDNHRLNKKIFKNFTDKDFQSVQFIIDNGHPEPKDLVVVEKSSVYVLQDKEGNQTEFESVTEMSEHFGFKAKNYWKKYIAEEGYEFIGMRDYE
jgi:hypothetical protein